MRLLLAIALAVPAVPAATAAAATPTTGPDGAKCGLVSALNPNAEAYTHTGVIFGGPLVVTDPATGLASGRLACTVQVGANTTHGTLANDARRVAAPGDGVVVLPPTLVSYTAMPVRQVYLCTEFRYDTGETFYWDAVGKAWTTDAGAPCNRATRVGTTTDDVDGLLDSVVCPVLDLVPLVSNTLRNLWGCDRGIVPGEVSGYVVVPDA